MQFCLLFFLQAILKELATKNGFVSHAKNKSNRINCLATSPIAQLIGTSWYIHDIQGSNPSSPIKTIELSNRRIII